MKIQKEGSATWQGTLKEGGGTISTQSGALNAIPYGLILASQELRALIPKSFLAPRMRAVLPWPCP